ncbi:uncharacterized protein LOC135810264 [Sycon ciliatum]|uniref:uncharacterized protein LOC135810264 n=1 Tax=Sycon ciliatum TaxID=27933 RepID=UPI0031F62CEC|eukprot:scpid16206/ scgid29359/ Suppressor of cytokine signaling 6
MAQANEFEVFEPIQRRRKSHGHGQRGSRTRDSNGDSYPRLVCPSEYGGKPDRKGRGGGHRPRDGSGPSDSTTLDAKDVAREQVDVAVERLKQRRRSPALEEERYLEEVKPLSRNAAKTRNVWSGKAADLHQLQSTATDSNKQPALSEAPPIPPRQRQHQLQEEDHAASSMRHYPPVERPSDRRSSTSVWSSASSRHSSDSLDCEQPPSLPSRALPPQSSITSSATSSSSLSSASPRVATSNASISRSVASTAAEPLWNYPRRISTPSAAGSDRSVSHTRSPSPRVALDPRYDVLWRLRNEAKNQQQREDLQQNRLTDPDHRVAAAYDSDSSLPPAEVYLPDAEQRNQAFMSQSHSNGEDGPPHVSLHKVMNELLQCRFYFGSFSGQEAMDLLSTMSDCSFLVRNSDDSRSLFAVTYRTEGRTGSTRIQYRDGLFSLNFQDTRLPKSPSVVDLIKRCMARSKREPVCMVYINDRQHIVYLRRPLIIPDYSLQQLARQAVHMHYTRADLERLELSGFMKLYMLSCPARPEPRQIQAIRDGQSAWRLRSDNGDDGEESDDGTEV